MKRRPQRYTLFPYTAFIRTKNDNSKSGCIANDDSTGKHNSSMRSNTGSKYNNIYQWINSTMFDNILIKISSTPSTTHCLWTNSNRNMDSNRCMRKNDYICIKNDNSKSGCIASDDSTGKHNSSMRSNTGSKYNNI